MTAILILGAAVGPDGPSPALRRRTAHGAWLYHRGAGRVIVACGGVGRHGPSEAGVMARLLGEIGVPGEAIRIEDTSTNTAQNIRHALPFLRDAEETDVLIVSDAYHLPRACLIARREGLQAMGSAPPRSDAQTWPQVRGWLREGPAILAVLLHLR